MPPGTFITCGTDGHVSSAEMKTCPFCAEDIKDAAIVCKHCGRNLMKTSQSSPVQTQVIVQQLPNQPSAGVAAVLSLIVPGAGQLYRGRLLSGLVWFVCVVVGYMLFIVPGLILHFCCIVAAASGSSPLQAAPVVMSGVSPPASASVASSPAKPSDGTFAKSVGRALAILVNPAATMRSNRIGAKVFLVAAYALIALYIIAFLVSRALPAATMRQAGVAAS